MRTSSLSFALLGSALMLAACTAVTNPPPASDTTGSVNTNTESSSTMEASSAADVSADASVYVYWEGFNPNDFDNPPVPDCDAASDKEECMVEFFCEPANPDKQDECHEKMPSILRANGML